MRWMIGFLAVLGLGCVAVGYLLFTADPATVPAPLANRPQDVQIAAFAAIFLAIVFERAAVVLSFGRSLRRPDVRWSIALITLCLVIALNSLFFALRVKGLLPASWTLLQLPPEEVTPPFEALLLSPVALVYALSPIRPDLWRSLRGIRNWRPNHTVQRVQRARSVLAERIVPRVMSLVTSLLMVTRQRSPAR